MNKLTLKDIAILDALPVYECEKRVLTVGAGGCELEEVLHNMGYEVHATDYEKTWENEIEGISYSVSDVFNLDSFPVSSAPVVICSQVLEHLVEYKKAFSNLMALTEIRLIITVPYKRSFNNTNPPPIGHCNHWIDHSGRLKYKNINEFKKMGAPYSVSISRIITKEEDRGEKGGYLIVVDKRQQII